MMAKYDDMFDFFGFCQTNEIVSRNIPLLYLQPPRSDFLHLLRLIDYFCITWIDLFPVVNSPKNKIL